MVKDGNQKDHWRVSMQICPNRSTTDQLFVIRQMVEKFYEYDIDLHVLFVDFRQAFDCINRKRFYKAMDENTR
jgi:hypothetical protein